MPIFKAIKESLETLRVFLEKVGSTGNIEQLSAVVNTKNGQGKTPLCALASFPESEATIQKLKLLLANEARFDAALPAYHPYTLAVNAGNTETAKILHTYSYE